MMPAIAFYHDGEREREREKKKKKGSKYKMLHSSELLTSVLSHFYYKQLIIQYLIIKENMGCKILATKPDGSPTFYHFAPPLARPIINEFTASK